MVELRCICWNLLAEDKQAEETWTDDNALAALQDFHGRAKNMLRQLREARADIAMLQEVDADLFRAYLLPSLGAEFDGLCAARPMEARRGAACPDVDVGAEGASAAAVPHMPEVRTVDEGVALNPSYGTGTAVLWRKSELSCSSVAAQLLSAEAVEPCLTVNLEHRSGRRVTAVAAHLSSGKTQAKEELRRAEAGVLVANLPSTANVVLGLDANAEAGEGMSGEPLAVPFLTSHLPVVATEALPWTTWKLRKQGKLIKRVVDYVLCSREARVKDVIGPKEDAGPMPNSREASDHALIGAAVEYAV